jgi:hypothetical protein
VTTAPGPDRVGVVGTGLPERCALRELTANQNTKDER